LFQRNILPVAGGWFDQSMWYVKAIRILSDEVATYEEYQAKQKR
jgi:hypothetical protein